MPNARELVRFLCAHGYVEARQTGSHLILEHPERKAIALPVHRRRDLPKGPFLRILKDARFTDLRLRFISDYFPPARIFASLFFRYVTLRIANSNLRPREEGKMSRSLFLLFLFLAHASSPAPNDPARKTDSAKPQACAEAKAPAAASECFAKLYVDADAQLNSAYNQIVSVMKALLTDAQRHADAAQIAHHQAALDRLLAAQRAWLNYRDLHCDSVKFQYDGGSISPAIWSQCMAETTQQRIAALTSDYAVTN
jgi:uncharacterized protein YecT (DUF1311 family)/predicted RNA binding protein YcfA (HicA-like mRNA interferase family)